MEPPLPAVDTSKALIQDVLDRATAVGVAVDCIDDFADTDGLFSKIIKHAGSFMMEVSTPDATFIDALQALGAELGRKGRYLSPHYTKLASLSRDFNLVRQKFNDNVSHVVQSQIMVTATGSSPVDLRDNLDKSVKHYEKERAKKSSKGFTERKQAALDTQQRVLQNTACDYVQQLQGVREKREMDFSKHLLALYKAQQQFFADSASILQEVVTISDQVLRATATERTKLDAAKPGLLDLRQKYERAVFNSERQEKDMDRVEKTGGRSSLGAIPATPGAAPTGAGAPTPGPAMTPMPARPALPKRVSELETMSFTSTATTDSIAQSREFLEDVMLATGNEVCADCSRERPRWGACDLGIVLCDDCASIHREPANSLKGEHRVLGMGPHVKQLTSLEQTDVDSVGLLMLKAIGNVNANAILEGRLASGPLAMLKIKPTAASSIDEKRAFIGKKYDLREYIIKTDRPLSLVTAFKAGVASKTGVAATLLAEVLAGANMASPDATEALHLAVAEGDALAVDFLLRNGCSANQSINSYTPLHVAAQMDRADVVKLLLRHGASPSAVDPSGKTALDLARASQSANVVRVLSQVSEGDGTVLREPIYVTLWARAGSPGSRRKRADPIYAQIDELGRSKPPSLSGSVTGSVTGDGAKPVPARKAPPPPMRPPGSDGDGEVPAGLKSPRSSRANIGVQVLPAAAGPVALHPPATPVSTAPMPAPFMPPPSSVPPAGAPPTAAPPSASTAMPPPNPATAAAAVAAAAARAPKPTPVPLKKAVVSVPPPPLPPPGDLAPEPPSFTELPPPNPPAQQAAPSSAPPSAPPPSSNSGTVPTTPVMGRASFSRPMIFIPPPPSATAGPPPASGTPTGPPPGPLPSVPPAGAPPSAPPPGMPPSAPPLSAIPPSMSHDDIPPFSPPKPPVSPRRGRSPEPSRRPPPVAARPGPPSMAPPSLAPPDPVSPDDLPAPPLSLVNPDVNLKSLDDEIEA
eukprot:m.235297 g.235297  ORF g.235297 m.235297 type:complete len:980 (-) comp12799_c0_seq1:715-3654(-)